jgi:uncharacterized LabA/DUF88 family protein
MPGDTYLFIDGEYLRRIYREAIQSVFNCDGDINFNEIKLQAHATRAFVYDCLDDIRRAGENDTDYNSRVDAQEKQFGKIRDLKGFHVRLGSLRGAPKRLRQKEVDVLLTVDMLSHGVDRNMETAILIAGDLDFRPIVEALVRRGVFVEIWYEEKSLAQELKWAADFGRSLDFPSLYAWSTHSFQARKSLPRVDQMHAAVANITSDRHGLYQGRNVRLIKSSDHPDFILRVERPGGVDWFEHGDQQVLERYYSVVYGPIQWQT